MKFSTATALAALVAVVSSAAIQRRGSPLPEHFGLAIVSDSPAIDGLRVRYTGSKLFSLLPNFFSILTSIEEYFTYVPSRPEAVCKLILPMLTYLVPDELPHKSPRWC